MGGLDPDTPPCPPWEDSSPSSRPQEALLCPHVPAGQTLAWESSLRVPKL